MDRVIFECNGLQIDPVNRQLSRAGVDVPLEPKAFAVLVVLLGRADELVTRDDLLDAVWGHRCVTPATLNRVMTLLRRVFDDDADNPRAIRTVHGAGYRFIAAIERSTVSRGEARARFGPPPVARLPAKLEPLVGRERELEQLGEMLEQHRAVTILGAGGMGKTQCALEAARLGSARFADGVWFFDLSPIEQAQEWLVTLAAALSVPTARTPQLLERIAAALATRDCQLVIDNCDRLAAEIGAIVLTLLRACPKLKILATSRQRLDFVGEHLMWLPPLQLPPLAAEARRLPISWIATIPAVELLLMRAAAVQPAIVLSATNIDDIVEICRRLDGMPLALELVAAQFAMLSSVAIRERLQQQVGLPASDSAGRERRHQTLHALVDWSYGLLSPPEQRLLCWLGVFLQGWTIDAAENIGLALGIASERLLHLHSGLILKSLVVVDPSLAPPRYRLLETVRDYALALLRRRGEEDDARRAHLAHFAQLAERSHREILDLRVDEWLERLRHENANIDGALSWTLGGGADPQSALRLVSALMLFGKCQGHISLLANWTERALDGVAPQASGTYVRALLCNGLFKLYVQDPVAQSRLTEAVTLAERIGDRWAQGCAAAHLSMWHCIQSRIDAARANVRMAIEIAEAEDDDWLRSLVGLASAWIALDGHDHAGVVAALEPVRRLGFDIHQHTMIEIYLALSHYEAGHGPEAAEALLITIDLAVRAQHQRSLAGGLECTSYLAIQTGRPEACARLLGKAADIRERSGAPLFRFWIDHHRAATRDACDGLGRARFDALLAAGKAARDEVVAEEARALLRS